MLGVGQTAANFSLPDQHGVQVAWASLRGKPAVVFVYPKADTPGCTREACAFRDLGAAFAEAGTTVLGLSADTVAAQQRFATKHGLTYRLLADVDRAVVRGWGAWGPKTMYGRTTEGIVRTTILFDADGVVARRWDKVKVEGHVEEVLAAAKALAA